MKCHSYPLSVLLLLIFCLPVSRSCLSNRKLTLYDTWSKYFLQIFYFVLAYSAFCHEESWFLSSWIYQCFLYGLCVILAHFFFFFYPGPLLMAQNYLIPFLTVRLQSFITSVLDWQQNTLGAFLPKSTFLELYSLSVVVWLLITLLGDFSRLKNPTFSQYGHSRKMFCIYL